MSNLVSIAVIADDIFERVLVDKEYGSSFLKRISNNEFGSSVYVTNMTVAAVLQKLNYKSNLKKRVKGLLYFLPQSDNKKKKKGSLIIEEPVRGQIWGEALDWFVRYSMPESKNKINLTLVNWADIGVLKFILKIYKYQSEVCYIVTKNSNYAKVAKLSNDDKKFPKFQIIS